MTRTPIEPGDIREGDLIRKLWVKCPAVRAVATEYVAYQDGDAYGPLVEGNFFLLDRPKPPVVLPSEPGHYLPAYENPKVFTLDAEGIWSCGLRETSIERVKHDCGNGMVKLEPVAETARKMRDAILAEYIPSFMSNDDVVRKVAADFGATS